MPPKATISVILGEETEKDYVPDSSKIDEDALEVDYPIRAWRFDRNE